jgi:ABC-type lipoprotein export system ATPase subunit
MKSLSIDLEHCYGIRKLSATLNFATGNVYAIYAPNGVMKSSLAQTFKDISDGVESRDRVFPNRQTKRGILDETGKALESNAVLVLPPYDAVFGSSEKTATLLVDAKLRKEYEQLFLEASKAKEAFLKSMKTQSRSKRDIEAEIAEIFASNDRLFYPAMMSAKAAVDAIEEPQFADIPYDLVADEKVAQLMASGEVAKVLQEYVEHYNKLLAQSKFFKKGTFNQYNAATIAKALGNNGFFDAKHTVVLVGDKRVEVKNQDELEQVIAKEKDAIMKDAKLRQRFDKMDKVMSKNEQLRDLQAFLSEHSEVLALMADMEKLKRAVWVDYFKANESDFNQVVKTYQLALARSKEIEAQAAKQRTQWERVIEIFNRRFFVPFELTAKNKVSVMLGEEEVPSLGFTFKDRDRSEEAEIERDDLIELLSTGEKKALYILNVIFEVEVRRQSKQQTVFVVDDIADSFDYKNKYAIIQYLKEIAEEAHFYQLILTHNFDFFRTIESRQVVAYQNCLVAERTSKGIELQQATGIRNVFKGWKAAFFKDPKKRLASIAFIRNLVEYTKGSTDPSFRTLTSLLHWKSDSATITNGELDAIYTATFGAPGTWENPTEPVLDTLQTEAHACRKAPEGASLENKIVLAIAIRIEAEKFMATKIADAAFLAKIKSHQTAKMLAKCKTVEGVSAASLEVLDRVALMTPENIHLNSFMYEPILDMTDEHLRRLYDEVLAIE